MWQLDNEVVIWDRIVRRKQDARVRIENGQNKYFFKEHSGSFRYVFYWSRIAHAQGPPGPLTSCPTPDLLFPRNVSEAQFVLKYNVMPYVGPLVYGEGGRTKGPVSFPSK
jgi:signal peptidase complex subunit 3